jgi:hypothetical protein
VRIQRWLHGLENEQIETMLSKKVDIRLINHSGLLHRFV